MLISYVSLLHKHMCPGTSTDHRIIVKPDRSAGIPSSNPGPTGHSLSLQPWLAKNPERPYCGRKARDMQSMRRLMLPHRLISNS